jgi:hypothetical protein
MTIYEDIQAERDRQDAQWGGPEHDNQHNHGDWNEWRRKFEDRANRPRDVIQQRDALIALAALYVAEIESLDRLAARVATALDRFNGEYSR